MAFRFVHTGDLLVAGDAFERANRTLRGQLVFRDGLGRLADADIPLTRVRSR